jgi:hypothetical protein
MRPIRHLILMLPLAALLLPAAAQAQAPVLQPLKPCYVSVDPAVRESVEVDASGFDPGSFVDVAIDGENVDSGVPVTVDGRISGSVQGPFQANGQRPFTLTVTEETDPSKTVSVQSKVTALSLRVRPKRAKPRRRVRFIGRGFTTGVPVYGHYVFGGKLRKTVRFGLPKGACGTFDVTRRQIPVKRPRTGRWTLQADTVDAYSRDPGTVFVRLAITVRRIFRGGR